MSTLLTFPLKEGKDFLNGCYSINPPPFWGEVSALLTMGCLKIVWILTFLYKLPFVDYIDIFPQKRERFFNDCYFLLEALSLRTQRLVFTNINQLYNVINNKKLSSVNIRYGRDFIDCYSLNPFPPWGKVPWKGDRVLKICWNYYF